MKKNKILRNKLTKEVEDSYTGKYKASLKEIKEALDLNVWKGIPCFCVERLNVMKWQNPQTDFMIQYKCFKITLTVFAEIDKLILRLI